MQKLHINDVYCGDIHCAFIPKGMTIELHEITHNLMHMKKTFHDNVQNLCTGLIFKINGLG